MALYKRAPAAEKFLRIMTEAEPPALVVPDSAPELREVASAPPGEALVAYERQSVNADELLKQFLNEVSDVARDAEVNRRVWSCSNDEMMTFATDLPSLHGRSRVLSCFKLNPFEFLNMRFDASPEDVRRQYRKVGAATSAVSL